jgi:hypothetical protein
MWSIFRRGYITRSPSGLLFLCSVVDGFGTGTLNKY